MLSLWNNTPYVLFDTCWYFVVPGCRILHPQYFFGVSSRFVSLSASAAPRTTLLSTYACTLSDFTSKSWCALHPASFYGLTVATLVEVRIQGGSDRPTAGSSCILLLVFDTSALVRSMLHLGRLQLLLRELALWNGFHYVRKGSTIL